MSWFFVSIIFIFSTILWDFSSSNGILGAISPSPENNVGLGDTATFTCIVYYRDRSTQNLLWQLSYRELNDVKFVNFSANLTKIDLPETPWTHGKYTLSYSDENTFEVLHLHIYNVTKGDANIEINCMYRILDQLSGVEIIRPVSYKSNALKLNVWTKPKCNTYFSGKAPTVITSNDILTTFVNCSSSDALMLIWNRIENGRRVQKGSTSMFSNTQPLELSTSDYGREYICGATVPRLSREIFELTCSVFPYFPQPKLTIDKSTISSGENLTMYCTYDTVPKPRSIFFWYINTTLLNNIENVMAVNITTTDIGSMLFLGSAYLPVGNTNVTCETVIPGINRTNTTVKVMVESPLVPTGHSPTYPKEVPLVAILVPTVFGVFVIIIVVIFVICFYLRRKHPAAKTGDQIKMSSDVTALDAAKNYPSLHSNGDNSNPSVSHDESPVYVMETNSKSIKDIRRTERSRKCSTKEGTSRSSNSDTHGNAKDTTDIQDNVPVKIESTSSEMIQRKQQTNVEGLAYADLEISNPNQTVEDEIVRTDDVTVYSEVKIE